MATPKVYVICDQKCLYESMTKEQILAAIAQAVTEGTVGDFDTGFIQTIKTINGLPLRFFVGSQNEYDALTAEQKQDLYAIITDDGTHDGFSAAIKALQTNYTELHDGLVSGAFVPQKAERATEDENGNNIIDTYERKATRVVYHNNSLNQVIATGFANKVYIGTLRSDKTLDKIVGMGLQVEFAGNVTITFGYTASKSGFAKEDSNGTFVNFAFVSPVVPTESSFTQNQINASLYLEDNKLYLCFNDGAYSWFKFVDGALSSVQSQCHNLSSGKFTLKSALWWYA